MAGQIEGKLHTSVPPAMGVQVAHSQHSSWGMSVVFLWRHRCLLSLWCHNCICRMLHPISIKNFEGHLGIKWSTNLFFSWSHWSRDSADIVFVLFLKPSKIFSEMAEPVITASSYKVAVLIMSHELRNTPEHKRHTSLHKSPGTVLKSLFALFRILSCFVKN